MAGTYLKGDFMSHFTKIDRANIVDAEAFIAACEELGYTNVKRNAQIKDYYGKEMRVDVAINCGRYDIALVKNADGNYDMVADWWGVRGSGLPDRLKGCSTDEDLQNTILRHTTKHTIVSRYKRQGFRAMISEDEEQNLHVELTRVR